MPDKSQAQRAYLEIHFGNAWVKKHHFDNKGHLPDHARAQKHATSKPRKRTKNPK